MEDSAEFQKKSFFLKKIENYKRTSGSLNERLPIKMTTERFLRKRYFFHEKDSRFYPQIIRKNVFLIGQVPIKKCGLKTLLLLFNI